MPAKRRAQKPSERPQSNETWGLLVTQLRVWITPEDAPPSRPFLALVLDPEQDLLLGQEMFPEPPTVEQIEGVLADAINRPAPGAGKPRRPAKVAFAEPALAESLVDTLAGVGIAWEVRPLPELEAVVRLLEEHLHGRPEFPGLLSLQGVTPQLAGELFAAAAAFYRAAPWVRLNNGQAFAVRFPAAGGPEWVASVMGNGGVEYGLALYKSWASFERLFLGKGEPIEQLMVPEGHVVLFLGDVGQLPIADYEAQQEHGWDVAEPQAYPLAMVYQAGAEPVRRPTAAELRHLIAALSAIPQVPLKPDSQGDYLNQELTITVTIAGRRQPVAVRYPAGRIAFERRPVDAEWEAPDDEETDDAPVIDRRMLEGTLSQMESELGAAEPADPKLRKAQKLMYKAWEESNPAKRLALAHKALTTSPDCADAYVLLAEEETDTLARALEFYRQGVAAGERALGAAYFEENRGHFWGLLETRPYMRARAGLALTLWSLQHPDEARQHYQALLELNPGDNQGLRYELLNLLLEMNRSAEAKALLKQYDDGMAEWLYTWALLEFQQHGAGKTANRRLAAALKQNPHVPAYVTGRRRIPVNLPPHYGFGDEDEAVQYAHRYLNHWRRTPGAVEWLKSKL
ncbi:MAG: tetratricopeptide repeat protein [Anaerolineales bacterium]|nr:tetratricopeptide repeat protein [Anaerolineales bacterium]